MAGSIFTRIKEELLPGEKSVQIANAEGQFNLQPEELSYDSEVDGKRDRLLEGLAHPFPGLASITQYFSAGLEEKRIVPQDVALRFQEETTTFEKLDQLSTKLAQVLKQELGTFHNGNPDGDIVFGVCAPPSDKLIVLIFAIMKLGGAYVPFDISFPENRVVKIVSVSKPVLIISDAHETTLRKFDPVKYETKVVTMDDVWAKLQAPEDSNIISVEPLEGNPTLYERTGIVLFTSGSSGEPKGVRLSHRTILNRLNWQWQQFPFESDESSCWKTALTFVDSVAEIFAPLLQGRPVVVFPKRNIVNTHLFVQKVWDNKITRLMVVPSFLQSILTMMDILEEKNGKAAMLSSVKLWMCSGEPLTHELLTRFFEKFPTGSKICNFYGSTEITDVTYEVFESPTDVKEKCIGERGTHVPIGQAVFNTVIYILGPKLELTPEGEIGEVYIAGYNLATGYVGGMGSDKFIINPYSKTPGFDRLFRTLDFGHITRMQSGRRALFYDGRLDSQVKVRGHRVDLIEIEEILNQISLVKKAVVLCYHAGQPNQQILAFVVPEDKRTAERIGSVLETKLLPYQMPVVNILEEIPMIATNGKTDRQRLLLEYQEELTDRPEFKNWGAYEIPQKSLPAFKAVIETVSQVTGTAVPDILRDLNGSFYNMGGTSLNSVTVIAELRKQKYFISFCDFVAAKSIRGLFHSLQYNVTDTNA